MKKEPDVMPNLGSLLRELRERRGLSLRQVYLKSGVSNSYLSQVETGQKIPSARVLSKLAPVYRVEVTTLLEEAGLMPKKTDELKAAEKRGKHIKLPPGLKELTEDEVIMEHFKISSFEITRVAEFNFKRGARPGKMEFLLLILFLRQIKA
ncbi:MAG: helix-turn-helix domain-containing protein [bacterium]